MRAGPVRVSGFLRSVFVPLGVVDVDLVVELLRVNDRLVGELLGVLALPPLDRLVGGLRAWRLSSESIATRAPCSTSFEAWMDLNGD